MKLGLEPRALGFLELEPAPSLLKAQAKPCLGPGLRGPGRAGLRALSPARYITKWYSTLTEDRAGDLWHPRHDRYTSSQWIDCRMFWEAIHQRCSRTIYEP